MDSTKRLQRIIKDLDKIKGDIKMFNFAFAFTYADDDVELGICSLLDKDIDDNVFYEMIYGFIDTKNQIDGNSSTDIDNFLNDN